MDERDHALNRSLHDAQEVRAVLGARDADIVKLDGDLAGLRAALEEKTREVDRRRGWRWWLRLPFIRMGLID